MSEHKFIELAQKDSHIVAVIDALGKTIEDLKFELRLKEIEIADLREKLDLSKEANRW
jgi:hypothetical protein